MLNRNNSKVAIPPSSQQQQPKSKNTLGEIQRLQKERDERRRVAEQMKQDRAAEDLRNRENGTPGDVDFQRMIKNYRQDQAPSEQPHIASSEMKIAICVRKRPISSKEIKKCDYDAITCLNPLVIVHDCKLKVDGISKYLDNTSFEVDHTFHEDNSTEEIYEHLVAPLVSFVAAGGRATVFAYGQTGSGKTFTMQGIQASMAEDLFLLLDTDAHVKTQCLVSYFEIYGGRCQDLLNSRNRLNVREDGSGEVVVSDLMEVESRTASELQSIIDTGNRNRTTHATESNDVSSRSHAICQISLRNSSTEKLISRLSLIDLAGSERGADTMSHNRQRRMEGAEINKSLLALKECIRALDSNSSHVPYRASKLTLVLKDSFTRRDSRTVMIANVSPAASSADHTLNTLRYADRIKERVVGGQQAAAMAAAKRDLPTPPPEGKNVREREKEKDRFSAKSSGSSSSSSKDVSPPPVQPHHQGGRLKGPGSGSASNSSSASSHDRASASAVPRRQVDAIEERDLRRDLLLEEDEDEDLDELHRTVSDLFEDEEALLNLHMNVIQENAELLTEEGRLLQQIQGDDGDMDAYASRLDEILHRKQELIIVLREKLLSFRGKLQLEEKVAQRMTGRLPVF